MFDMSDKTDPNYANMQKLLDLQKKLMMLLSELRELDIDNFVVMKEYNNICNYRNELSDLIKKQSRWERKKISIDTTGIEKYINRMKSEIKSFKTRQEVVWTEKRLPNGLIQDMITFEENQEQN